MESEPSHVEPSDIAGIASTERGMVFLDGPNGVAIAMTPECAEQTARNLLAAAEKARSLPPRTA